MLSGVLDQSTKLTLQHTCIIIMAGMIAVIGSALAFEYIGGYQPCKLCLQQRLPWYAGVPVMGLASVSAYLQWSSKLTRILIGMAGLIMIVSFVLGLRHAGVEWGWWAGPSDCGAVEGGIAAETENFLQQLQDTVPPACDDAPLRILGLSFAGWNAIASAFLAALALRTVTK